jgi:hypothetical protein
MHVCRFPDPRGFLKSLWMSCIGYVNGGAPHAATTWASRIVLFGYCFFMYISGEHTPYMYVCVCTSQVSTRRTCTCVCVYISGEHTPYTSVFTHISDAVAHTHTHTPYTKIHVCAPAAAAASCIVVFGYWFFMYNSGEHTRTTYTFLYLYIR